MTTDQVVKHADYKKWFDVVFNAAAPEATDSKDEKCDEGDKRAEGEEDGEGDEDDEGEDDTESPRCEIVYTCQDLVQPRANFINITAYHAANLKDSCNDCLCKAPKAFDAVSAG